jgi:hypothetical protein
MKWHLKFSGVGVGVGEGGGRYVVEMSHSSARIQEPLKKMALCSFKMSGTIQPALECHISDEQNPREKVHPDVSKFHQTTRCHITEDGNIHRT